jgi:hypothetical protein
MFTDFFHKLFHPHCEICLLAERERLEREEDAKVCKSCESWKFELAKEREVSRKLLDSILTAQAANAIVETREPLGGSEPISGGYIPWHIKKERLEAASRKQALELRDKVTTEQLEKELLGEGK